MDILAVQQRFMDAGFIVEEIVSNFNCYICVERNRMQPIGIWHRFESQNRMMAWKMAAEWLDRLEAEEM